MTDDTIAALRAELAGLTSAARTRPLLQLGQALSNAYWRAGPGTPAGLPHLDAAIEAIDEAYGYLERDDALRATAAAQLGVLLAARYGAHGGAERDREDGIFRLEEALAAPALPGTLKAMARLYLGQLYLSRVVQGLQADAMAALRAGTAAASGTDVERAIGCFQDVLATEGLVPEMRSAAETLLTIAEAVQTLTGGIGGGQLGGFDMSRMMQALSTMQQLQERFRGGGMFGSGAGMPQAPTFLDAESLARLDPLDRPVTVAAGPMPAAPAAPPPPAPEAVPAAGDAELRREVHELVTRLGGDPEVYASAAALLRAGAPAVAAGDIDDLVGLATILVHSGGIEVGADCFLLAVGLELRARAEDADPDDPDGDHQAAAESLAAALESLPPEHPAAAVALSCLDAFVDRDGRLADRALYGGAAAEDVVETLRGIGVEAMVRPYGDGAYLVLDVASEKVSRSWPPSQRRLMIVSRAPVPVPDGAVVSYVASAVQALAVARRDLRQVAERPVFVANPRGDREAASFDAVILRRMFYPRSVGLGRTIEQVSGDGTPDDVLAHLDASILQLGCGATGAGLELAGPAVLEVDAIRSHAGETGGLAILPSCAGEAFPTLATALIEAGFAGVTGWDRPVPLATESLALFMLHTRLVDEGLPAVLAVHSVRSWMADPGRAAPPHLPAAYAAALHDPRLADFDRWAALRYWGR